MNLEAHLEGLLLDWTARLTGGAKSYHCWRRRQSGHSLLTRPFLKCDVFLTFSTFFWLCAEARPCGKKFWGGKVSIPPLQCNKGAL
jgi:hypothetical protein